jgi:hypothetical protein
MESNQHIRITVRGRLSERLAAAFDPMTLVARDGATELVGQIVDHAQLYGLLTRVRDLGLELESVVVVDPRGGRSHISSSGQEGCGQVPMPRPDPCQTLAGIRGDAHKLAREPKEA